MNLRQIISKFVTQICEKKYADANTTLDTIVTEKVKTRINDAKSKLKKDDDCGCGCGGDCKKDKNKKNKKPFKSKKVTKKVTKKG